MKVSLFLLVVCALFLGACQGVTATPPAVTEVLEGETAEQQAVALINTPIPTANLQPTRTATIPLTATPTITPSYTPTLTPTVTNTPTVTLTPSRTPIPTNTATTPPTHTLTLPPSATFIASATTTGLFEDPNSTPRPTWTPPPPDPATQIQDHYALGRPIAAEFTNWVDRTYPYGNTRGGRLQTHRGVEFVNGQGTTIRAAGAGTVFYAGDDLATLFGPINNYYGYLVVIQHPLTDSSGQPVYTLYGHMLRVDVQPGQQVAEGDTIGLVGGTGVALGPHLHFEVRVGDPYNFDSTRNPELWIRPFRTYGTLAGKVTDSAGNTLYDVTLTVQSERITRYAFSYADDTVNGDSLFGENFTLGDLPADWYTVTVGEGGVVRFRQLIYIYPNRTTWLNVALN